MKVSLDRSLEKQVVVLRPQKKEVALHENRQMFL
jgi:hypothetical protein